MADQVTCPTLSDFLNEEQCLENIAGTSAIAYYFVKSDLQTPISRTGNIYATPVFKSGKGLYKFDLKDGSQKIEGESQGNNKGFNLTYDAIIDAVNKKASELSRSLNNLDIGIIVPDGEDSQIMYDPNHRVKCDSGGIKSTTGAAPGDDRNTTLQFKLEGVLYDNLYVTPPETGGWDSLLASAAQH